MVPFRLVLDHCGSYGRVLRGVARRPVIVMSRNLYLGADIQRPVNAAVAAQLAGGTQQDIVVALANATTVDHDFLQILLDALAALGAEYEAVKIGNWADVES